MASTDSFSVTRPPPWGTDSPRISSQKITGVDIEIASSRTSPWVSKPYEVNSRALLAPIAARQLS
ncbi:Uncharacterised protein [Mycobacteroides abscessus subsp. abscessus]|nr:Uncharacterised protein [Mycobacteroides abscessus subsp. abscessus]